MKKLLSLSLFFILIPAILFGGTIQEMHRAILFKSIAPIELDLTSTALIEAWNIIHAASYTRASSINVFDFQPIIKTAGTNVAALYGARQVTNLYLYSQDISQASWIKDIGVTITGTDGFTANSENDWVTYSLSSIEQHVYRLSFNAHVESGQLTGYSFRHANSVTGTAEVLPTLTRTAKRYSTLFLGRVGGGSTPCGFQDGNSSNFAKVTITDFQVEDVTGQTNQNPSNHIPTTTAAVSKYYNTKDGNTVSSNVVTEAVGADLTNTIGLANSPSKTNVVLAYRDFTDAAWNPVNGSITAGDVVLIDGTTVADKNTFTASAANATLILDPYVSASGVHAGGVFIKRKTGTGAIEVTMDGGSTWVAVTSDILTTDWFNAQTTLPTVTDPEFGIRLITDTDAVYLDWCQIDDGAAFVNSHSPIVGGTTLALADLHCSSTGLITASKGSIYLEYQALPDYNADINDTVLLGNGDCEIRAEALTSGISFNDGTNDTVGYAGTPSGVIKAVVTWSGSSVSITTANGTTTGTGAENWGADTIYFGRNSTGSAFPGILINYKFYYNEALSQAEAEALVN